jgi:hypothetical protein
MLEIITGSLSQRMSPLSRHYSRKILRVGHSILASYVLMII